MMRWIAGLVGALAVAWGGSAGAVTIVHLSFEGTVVDGTDGGGLFGPVGASLAGDTFSAEFTATYTIPGQPYSSNIVADIQSAQLTIGATTVNVPVTMPEGGSVLDDKYGSPSGQIGAYTGFGSPHSALYAAVNSDDIAISGSNFTVTTVPADISSSSVGSFNLDGGQTTGDLLPTSGSSDVLPPLNTVPEPASWADLILGFGFVGLTLRRRSLALA